MPRSRRRPRKRGQRGKMKNEKKSKKMTRKRKIMGEDREPTRKREASDDSDSEIPDSLDFSGNAHDFNIPPDDEMIPKRIDIGSWVFAVFKESGRTAVRGIVVSRTKRRATDSSIRRKQRPTRRLRNVQLSTVKDTRRGRGD